MVTLYLNVPRDKADGEGKKSYAETLNSAIGSGYAMSMDNAIKCTSGSSVVLLCSETKERAEGKVKLLKMTGEATKSGIVRYDVYMEGLTTTPYQPAPANFGRTGILVIKR